MAYPKTHQNGDTVRIALHTRVRAERIDQYEAAHRAVPAELTDAIRAGGVHDYSADGAAAALPVVWKL
jgi:L-rhamnose mutarotase